MSVALIVNPKEGTALAQCGRRRVTGFKKTKPCGPHITSGESIASPVTEFIDHVFAIMNDIPETVMVNAANIDNANILVISIKPNLIVSIFDFKIVLASR